MRTLPVVTGLAFLLSLVTLAAAQERIPPNGPGLGPRLDRVVITGNQRVDEEAIRVQLHSQPGTRFNEETVDKDIRALYRMGFFDNVEANLNQEKGLWTLTFHVTERPLIKAVKIEGNKKISREDLEGAFKVRPNTIFDPEKVRSGIEEAKNLYEKMK